MVNVYWAQTYKTS